MPFLGMVGVGGGREGGRKEEGKFGVSRFPCEE